MLPSVIRISQTLVTVNYITSMSIPIIIIIINSGRSVTEYIVNYVEISLLAWLILIKSQSFSCYEARWAL